MNTAVAAPAVTVMAAEVPLIDHKIVGKGREGRNLYFLNLRNPLGLDWVDALARLLLERNGFCTRIRKAHLIERTEPHFPALARDLKPERPPLCGTLHHQIEAIPDWMPPLIFYCLHLNSRQRF